MPVIATCSCGASYNLKDEYSGQQLACPKCGAAISVPVLPPVPPPHAQAGDQVFAHDRFLLNQRHMAINEKYTVSDESGAPLLYVERPRRIILNVLAIFGGLAAAVLNYLAASAAYAAVRATATGPMLAAFSVWMILGSMAVFALAAMALSARRHVTVYRDDSKAEVLLRVLQENKIILFTARFVVADHEGNHLGRLHKNHLHNILRKRWYALTPEGELLFTAKEDSIILSILRRFLGPMLGLLRTNFLFFGRDGAVLGEFNRKMTVLDRYVLDLSEDSLRTLDRRLALALGVMLDTGEKR
jgi:hypothetical protein